MLKDKLIKYLRLVYIEVFLILCGSIFYIKTIPHELPVIKSDGKGYYDYLPAFFIYNDLSFSFRGKDFDKYPADTSQNIPTKNGRIVNKFTCGTALLNTPFFLIGHFWAWNSDKHPVDGYSKPYQQSIYIGALFYCCMGLVFLKLLLIAYFRNIFWIRVIQFLVLYSTHLFIFTYHESSFSHVYSFSLITIFLFVTKSISDQKENVERNLFFSFGILLGLIILVRPFNILILLFLPFLFGGISPLYQILKQLFHKRKTDLFFTGLFFLLICSIQPMIWLIQAGVFLPWTHSEEGFNFFEPAMFQTLFSFKKGLLIYTPVLILAFILFIQLILKNKWSVFFQLFGAVFILHYFISSWSCWWYAMSFGLRPYVDYLSVFALIIYLGTIHLKPYLKIITSGLVFLSAYLNLIQTYQYTTYILHWESMTYESYMKVFLKTDDQYKGFLWFDRKFNNPDREYLLNIYKINEKGLLLKEGEWITGYNRDFDLTKDQFARGFNFVFEIDANVNDKTIFFMRITDLEKNQELIYHERFLFHLMEDYGMKKEINYFILLSHPPQSKINLVFGFRKIENPLHFRPIQIEFYR
ncbi:MAG: hypothetical protein ACOZCO_04480 [Bacteroidota bacterium]